MRALLYVLGLVAIGTAWRRDGDLGNLLGESAFWTLAAAGAIALIASARLERDDTRPIGVGGLIALAFGSGWCALRGDAAGWLTAGAGIAACALACSARTRDIARRLVFVATAFLAATVVTELATRLETLRVPTALVASFFARLLSLFGARASSSDDLVIVDGFLSDLGFRVTPFALGVSIHAAIAVHAAFTAWSGARIAGLRASAWRPLAYFVAAATLRFALLIATSITLEATRQYEDEHFPLSAWFDWRFGLAFDALAALVAARIFLTATSSTSATSATEPVAETAPAPTARFASAYAVAGLAGVLLASDRIVDCAGVTKPGRIAIDEGHSQWEATDVELGRDYYGTESGYNFRTIVEWLEVGYGPVRRLYDPITPATLDDFDVLIVKTPTRVFDAAERRAVHDWVKRGGGLVLIGDHTNVFGTSSILNALAEPFGFHYDYDCLFEEAHRFEENYLVEPQLARHPVLRPLEAVRFEVGCSIDIDSLDTRALIVGRGLKSQPIDYRVSNFYGKPRDQSQMRFGPFAQLAVRPSGSGRVVAVADSTLFSTFSICIPGRRELVEGMVAYVNRTDVGENVRRVARALGLAAFGAALLLMRGRGLFAASASALLVAGAMRASISASEEWLYPGHPASPAGVQSRELWFERSDGVDWAVERFIQDHDKTYDLFFQYAARTGQFPRIVEGLDACLAGDAPLVLLDPDASDAASVPAVLEHVRRGRSVIVIESRPSAFVDALASAAGISVSAPASDSTTVRLLSAYGPTAGAHAHPPARELSGGEPLLVAELARDGEPRRRTIVGTHVALGTGHLALITAGACFTNAEHGYSFSQVPDADRRRLYEFQFDLLAAASSEVAP